MTTVRRLGDDPTRPITIAVLAMGGQGGGVLVDWIVDLAEHNGFLAQATSVAGVAQRTGATVYYLELFAEAHVQALRGPPIFALMPVPGEVDIVIASELMEAGRALQRGLVTPDRTTLICSSHRDYATLEKVAPGNGIADAAAVLEAGQTHALRFLHEDMKALAQKSGSVISATLFGALAGCGELPFSESAFEATIQRAGIGVEASLRALAAGVRAMREPVRVELAPDPMATSPRELPTRAASPAVEPLRQRIANTFPAHAHAMLGAGLQRVLEYQDIAYGHEYLDHMTRLQIRADACGSAVQAHLATLEAARWVAVAMAYDDIIRVADLKTRASRTARVRAEIGAGPDEVVGTVEYFHPRLEEILALLPPRLANGLARNHWLTGLLSAALARGQRVRPHTVRGHLLLHGLASLRHWRRHSLRHHQERAHLSAWLSQVLAIMPSDYALALELIRCRRVIKGYSDTHARGNSKFDRLSRAATMLQGRADAATALAALRAAALAEPGLTLLTQRWQELGLPEVTEISVETS